MTRHPRMGAVEELKVPLGELAENRRLIEKGVLRRSLEGEHTLLLVNHMSLNP